MSGRPDITLAGLRVVRQAVASGSFTEAAAALGYTQSGVSRQIAAAELAVGTPLFERAGRGVRPTEAAELLAEHAGTVLATLEGALSTIARRQARLDGRVALGSVPVAMSVLVPRALARIAAASPGLIVAPQEASTPVLIDRVRHGLVDVAVVGTGNDLPSYDLHDLRQDLLMVDTLRVAVAVDHRLAGRERVPVSELSRERWIVGQPASERDPFFGPWPGLPEPEVAYASREWPARLGMVAAGLGIALLPHIAAESVPSGVAVIDVVDPTQSPRSAVALTPADATPNAQAVVSALRITAAHIAMTRPRRDAAA